MIEKLQKEIENEIKQMVSVPNLKVILKFAKALNERTENEIKEIIGNE